MITTLSLQSHWKTSIIQNTAEVLISSEIAKLLEPGRFTRIHFTLIIVLELLYPLSTAQRIEVARCIGVVLWSEECGVSPVFVVFTLADTPAARL